MFLSISLCSFYPSGQGKERPLDRRHAYEKELLQTIAQMTRDAARKAAEGPRIADATRTLERSLLKRMEHAVAEMRAAIAEVNACSALVGIRARAFEDFVADEIPSARNWDEKLSHAANGW